MKKKQLQLNLAYDMRRLMPALGGPILMKHYSVFNQISLTLASSIKAHLEGFTVAGRKEFA